MKTIYFFLCFTLGFLVSCSKSSSDGVGSETGIGGSMARFTVIGDYLYTVDNNNLNIFDVSNAEQPMYVSKSQVGFNIETIFPKDTILFIGAQTGMYIFNIKNPQNPYQISYYQHIYSCDPVIADDHYAYVTLHSENSRCGRLTNELHIIDISDINNPTEVKIYPMSNPLGLGKQGDKLFVCDYGLKIFDAQNVLSLKLCNHLSISAYDVIPLDNKILVIGEDGLYQYNYNNCDISLISKIEILRDNNIP